MDGWELLLRQHAGSHAAAVADAAGVELGDEPFEGLDDLQLRSQPHGLNSIAWLIWHIARCEDVVVNAILADRPQVFDEQAWSRRINVARRDIGTEMTVEEVAALSAAVDLPQLRAYRTAVGKRTRAWLQTLPDTGLDDVTPLAGISGALTEGALGPNAGWVAELWAEQTQPWFLHWEVIGHNYLHLGQALWVRKLLLAAS